MKCTRRFNISTNLELDGVIDTTFRQGCSPRGVNGVFAISIEEGAWVAIDRFTSDFRKDHELLSKLSLDSDQVGYPTAQLVDYLLDRNVHLALLPERFGGEFLSPTQEFTLILEASKVSATFGWIVFQLCGNMGRVLSFFPDEFVANFVGAHQRAVICYQTDPRHGSICSTSGELLLKGRWPMGSLAAVATHFAAPYVSANHIDMCALVSRADVTIIEDWRLPGLRGTSTWSYELSVTPVSVSPIACNNRSFLPWYRVPRASIKHSAHSLGIIWWLANLQLNEPAACTDRELWNRVRVAADNAIERATEAVVELERSLMDSAALETLNSLEQELSEFNRHLHSWMLEVGFTAYQAGPRLAKEVKTKIVSVLQDVEAICSHLAVRAKPEHLLHYMSNSPRLRSVLSRND